MEINGICRRMRKGNRGKLMQRLIKFLATWLKEEDKTEEAKKENERGKTRDPRAPSK